jgi:hypothetical protein
MLKAMESFDQRLKRYTSQNDLEIFGWLTIWLQNAYLSELRLAKENRLYHSVYLITHAIIQIVAEKMFGLRGRNGTEFYLQNFVDGDTRDRRFSLVADDIHGARNVMAHEGYSSLQHRVNYFSDEMAEGWKREANTVFLNPAIYAEQFQNAFVQGAHVLKYRQLTDRVRTLRKYQYIRQWLRLEKSNPIAQEIKKLEACTTLPDVRTREANIQKMIYQAYNLT